VVRPKSLLCIIDKIKRYGQMGPTIIRSIALLKKFSSKAILFVGRPRKSGMRYDVDLHSACLSLCG